jgi:glutamyl-tRNA synthetase
MEELRALNARTIHQMPFASVRARLPDGMSEALWLAVRPNLATVSEAAAWLQVIEHDVDLPAIDPADREYMAAAAKAADAISWDEDPWHALTGVLKDQTGRKGRSLFLPLRVALTGQEHGPDMKALLPLIGRDRTVARLNAAAQA